MSDLIPWFGVLHMRPECASLVKFNVGIGVGWVSVEDLCGDQAQQKPSDSTSDFGCTSRLARLQCELSP